MTDQPAPETSAKLAAATEDSSATASPPSDWPAFARALEIQRNAARAERGELNRQLSVALKGKRPYSAEFADETIAAQVKRIAELEEKLNGWFSERNAAHAEISQLRAELADERAKKSDALIAAVQDITRLATKHNAVRANNRELKELLVLLARAIHDENWKEIGNLVPRMNAALATPQ